ncbi:hypothetical protein FOS14_22985 [Skermania sp. ID1734]|uniref:hypothetical protein n=1 Tax=Skermania sp. ID1734 TaxID=2597516 RepID=UPI00117F46FE|nr:hypothetical protein [Skermania sp. ID1734]TSD93421.1 hypothetical protein FOS14_22985 [Skermania sp. ID1734]
MAAPTQRDNDVPRDAVPAARSLAFTDMRAFVESYYALLPSAPEQAWPMLAGSLQAKGGGFSEYLQWWGSVASVTVRSVQPRDATSVSADLEYSRRDGTTQDEIRWLEVHDVDGQRLITDSAVS